MALDIARILIFAILTFLFITGTIIVFGFFLILFMLAPLAFFA